MTSLVIIVIITLAILTALIIGLVIFAYSMILKSAKQLSSIGKLDDEFRKEVEDAEITYPEEQVLHGGEVTMNIGVDENGDLAVTEYAASNIAGNWFTTNATVNLPETVSINGTEYPILGLSQPLSIEVCGVIISKDISVNVPEGYEYVCDNAFNTISCVRNTIMTFNLPVSLRYLGYETFKMDINRLTVEIKYSGTKEQFKTLIADSTDKYGSGYTFFSRASDYVSVKCSDGEVTYTSNVQYYSD